VSTAVNAAVASTPGQAPGALRKLATPFVDPAVFDFWARKLNPTWSWARPLARVVERREEAQDTVTLVLRPNAHCGVVQPGQHLNVSAELNGRRTTRSYSITNLPEADGRIAITVKRVEGGALSTHLCRHAQVGDVLELGPAFGDMTWPARPGQYTRRWAFLAAGSGITPLISLTREWAARQLPVELTLIYWVKTRAEACFVQELRDLAAHNAHFRFHLVLTHAADDQGDAPQGLISAEQIQQLLPQLPDTQIYSCGPGGFVEAARQLTGTRAAGFQAEGFTPAPLPESEAETTTVQVQLKRSGRALFVSTGQSLLEALEAQGLNPPSGCRMGICHTCTCTRLSGSTANTQAGTTESEPDGQVRLCISRARTDLELDL
jgi:stearoyl-CoA 9-desaturase NADPH oxidoreductase